MIEIGKDLIATLVKTATAAVEVKGMLFRREVRKAVSKQVNKHLDSQTERKLAAALAPVIKAQVSAIVANLRRMSKSQVELILKVHNPHKIRRRDKWVVVDDDGKVYGSHGTEAEADAQLAALYLNKSFSTSTILDSVPDIRQPDHWECGVCAAMGVGKYFGVGPDTLAEWRDRLGASEENSTDPKAIVAELKSLGLDPAPRHGMTIDDLARSIEEGRPVIVCVQDYMSRRPAKATYDYGHYLTVIGVVGGSVKMLKGGPGSGNFGHEGRPGQVGGSGVGDGSALGRTIKPLDEGWRPPDASGQPDKTKANAKWVWAVNPERENYLSAHLDKETLHRHINATREWTNSVTTPDSNRLKDAASKILGIESTSREKATDEDIKALELERSLTASYVKEHFGDKVNLVRGLGKRFMEAHPNLKEGDVVEISMDSLSSWTKNEKFATQFARNVRGTQGRTMKGDLGAVVEAEFSHNDVFMISDLSDGHNLKYLGESGKEFVVGTNRPTVKVVVKKIVNCVPKRAE